VEETVLDNAYTNWRARSRAITSGQVLPTPCSASSKTQRGTSRGYLILHIAQRWQCWTIRKLQIESCPIVIWTSLVFCQDKIFSVS
jgi:hypothetical protein